MAKRDFGAKAPSKRQLRVGELIRQSLTELLQRDVINDPEVQKQPVTVTEVSVSPDLRNATAFVVPFGGGEHKPVVDALNRTAGFVGGHVARAVKLRYAPKIRFIYDVSFDRASEIEAALNSPRVQSDIDDGS